MSTGVKVVVITGLAFALTGGCSSELELAGSNRDALNASKMRMRNSLDADLEAFDRGYQVLLFRDVTDITSLSHMLKDGETSEAACEWMNGLTAKQIIAVGKYAAEWDAIIADLERKIREDAAKVPELQAGADKAIAEFRDYVRSGGPDQKRTDMLSAQATKSFERLKQLHEKVNSLSTQLAETQKAAIKALREYDPRPK